MSSYFTSYTTLAMAPQGVVAKFDIRYPQFESHQKQSFLRNCQLMRKGASAPWDKIGHTENWSKSGQSRYKKAEPKMKTRISALFRFSVSGKSIPAEIMSNCCQIGRSDSSRMAEPRTRWWRQPYRPLNQKLMSQKISILMIPELLPVFVGRYRKLSIAGAKFGDLDKLGCFVKNVGCCPTCLCLGNEEK